MSVILAIAALTVLLTGATPASPRPAQKAAAWSQVYERDFPLIVRSVRSAAAAAGARLENLKRAGKDLGDVPQRLSRMQILLEAPAKPAEWLPDQKDDRWFFNASVIIDCLGAGIGIDPLRQKEALSRTRAIRKLLVAQYNAAASSRGADLTAWGLPLRQPADTGAGPKVDADADGATAGSPGAAGDRPGTQEAVSRRIVDFALRQLGRQVGRGECWDLAAVALRVAGARPPDGYVFGREVPVESVEPGDILQFTTARFEWSTGRQRFFCTLGTPRHTAVVYAASGGTIQLLHQNYEGRVVTRYDLRIGSRVSGDVRAYRPIPVGSRAE